MSYGAVARSLKVPHTKQNIGSSAGIASRGEPSTVSLGVI